MFMFLQIYFQRRTSAVNLLYVAKHWSSNGFKICSATLVWKCFSISCKGLPRDAWKEIFGAASGNEGSWYTLVQWRHRWACVYVTHSLNFSVLPHCFLLYWIIVFLPWLFSKSSAEELLYLWNGLIRCPSEFRTDIC